MALAFWRRKSNSTNSARAGASRRKLSSVDHPTARSAADDVRIRARRRLIGAAALLLTVAIVVPMVLDPEPKPAPDNVVIDIPSERTPFTPRLALPPVPGPENVPVAPVPEVSPLPEKADEPGKVETKKGDEQRARALLEGKSAAKPTMMSGKERFALQAAAPASETAARELAERLKKAGHASYMEKVDTKEGARYRVRLGPYASRDEADGVRARLKNQGINANLITL